MLAPLGHGFTIDNSFKKIILVGGGIGTPPMLPLAKIYGERTTVISGFRSAEAVILQRDFKAAGAETILCTEDVYKRQVDIKNEMLVLAKRKIEAEYEKNSLKFDNIRIFIKNIMQIDSVFSKEDGIERIYINFCNPWPKSKHKKRRLTHYRQLIKYKEFLNGEIWFKTDDDDLFAESVEYFEQAGYKIKYKTYDLHGSGFKENIVTEHEQMFTDEGKKIKFLIAST